MKNALLTLLILTGIGWAQDEESENEGAEAGPSPDAAKLLNDLAAANEAKDPGKIDMLLKDIQEVGKRAKNTELVDPLAKALSKSVRICRGNYGTLRKLMTTFGELRSKHGVRPLKKAGFRKKAEKPEDQELQGAAINALGMLRDPKLISGIADQTKSKYVSVAMAAYEAFKHYASSPGKVRRNIAGVLMKRLEMEYPATGGSKRVSAEKRARWQKIAPVVIASMQAICRENTINDVDNWRLWWKEYKKKAKYWKDEKKS